MADSFSIKAILSAKDVGFSSGMKGALKSLKEVSTQIKGGFAFGVMAKAGSSAEEQKADQRRQERAAKLCRNNCV